MININYTFFIRLSLIVMLAVLGISSQSFAISNNDYLTYDKNSIISNGTFTSFRDFPDSNAVQQYLNKKNSILKDYYDKNMKASDIIFKSATGEISSYLNRKTSVSPALLITMLEKEQSLISTTSYDIKKDESRKLKSAMGYGCPDTAKCNPDYEGFYNQVSWGAFQLRYNYDNSKNNSFMPYNLGNKFKTMDNIEVKIENEATASLYRYTPHVFWGNYNVFKIMTVNGWTTTKQNVTFQTVDQVNKLQILSLQCKDIYFKKFKIGDNNDKVTNLQDCLKSINLYDYPVTTGYFGPLTQRGLTTYLESQKRCERFYYKTFSIGTSGQEITDLQQCLINNKLFSLSKPTGYYGPITEAAINKFKN